ncbi:MAG: CoA pyrophosphatase [Candidatus Eisenbacteria sp.]|nr:CoA pyrophosphatase [Candidatus Eisenbacteria bacterium]
MASIRGRLKRALRQPLPGGKAQQLMAPVPRPGWDPAHKTRDGQPAAVLVLIYPLETAAAKEAREGAATGWERCAPVVPHGLGAESASIREPAPDDADPEGVANKGTPGLVLTERTAFLESHRAQISFPGGTIEEGESPEQAALREAFEETGIPQELPESLGRLSQLWIPASGYAVTPVVATATCRPVFKPNPDEVKRILEVPLTDLLRPGSVQISARSTDGFWMKVRYFDVEGAWLWGATAMMLAELLVLLGWRGPDV